MFSSFVVGDYEKNPEPFIPIDFLPEKV